MSLFAGFSFLKLLSGFNIFDGQTLGKIIWNVIITLIVIAIVGLIGWKIFFQRTNAVHSDIAKVDNYYACPVTVDPATFIGVKLWRVRLGLSF